MLERINVIFTKKRIVYSVVFSFFFSLSFVLGYQLQNYGYTRDGLWGNIQMVLLSAFVAIPVSVFAAYIIYLLDNTDRYVSVGISVSQSASLFLLLWVIIFVFWIPVFLAYYPCVMSSDFDIQLYQVKQGHSAFTNHHPYLSTLEIELFYNLRDAFGTVRKAMAALGLWHLLVLSSAFAFLTLTIYRISGKKWIMVVCLFAFVIYPVNPVMGLSTTKDVVFSSAFTYFMCLLIWKFYIGKAKKSNQFAWGKNDIFILLLGVLVCSYRNNAKYAILASALFAIIFVKRDAKIWLTIMTFGVILLYLCSQKGIESYLGVKGKAKTPEMHSVIIQTLGRTYNAKNDLLSDSDRALIEYYIPKEALQNYNPALSDPLKTPVTEKTFDSNWNNMAKVLIDWVKIGLKYPDEYKDAFLDLTRGYWYIYDTSYATVWGADLHFRMGLLYTNNTSGYYGMDEIWHESKLPSLELVYEKILSRNDFFNWPVLNMFFRLAFYVWIFAFFLVFSIYKRNKNIILISFVPLFYMGTLFLGPTAYIRYIFPIMMFVPLMVICSIYRWKESDLGY